MEDCLRTLGDNAMGSYLGLMITESIRDPFY